MECVSYSIEAEVPPELSTASTCSTAFFRVASMMDQLDGKEGVRKHSVFTTSRGHVVEVEGGTVQRSAPCPKDVTKIVVHHDFESLQLYIVLLCSSGTAVLLDYQDLKVLHEWEGVNYIASADPTASGAPQLVLKKLNDQVVISNGELMSYGDGGGGKERKEEEDSAGKKEVVEGLMHMFKEGIKHVEQLRNERKMKENFITEELAVLQSQLQGQLGEREKGLVSPLNVEGRKPEQKESVPPVPPNPLKVLRVHHRLVHDKWVVGVSVMNDAERVLVSRLELVLFCGEGTLCHTSQVLKTVKHSRPRGSTEDARATIDPLDPPVLRPKKKATVVGVCEVPSFETGPSVSCSGLLSFTCKPLEPNKECQVQEYQMSLPLAELKASELHCHLASLELSKFVETANVTFSTVALVAASRCTQVSLSSLVSPLTTFLTRISRHHELSKMSGVTDFYVLHSGESHPLQHTAFTLHPLDSHNINLNLYSKDEKQTLVLAHTLLAALPEDVSMQFLPVLEAAGRCVMPPLKVQHMLLAKMREAATHVTDGLEAQLTTTTTSKAPRLDRKEGSGEQEGASDTCMKERKELPARKGNIEFKGEEYMAWRKKLQDIQKEVDSLYLRFLKLNCASD